MRARTGVVANGHDPLFEREVLRRVPGEGGVRDPPESRFEKPVQDGHVVLFVTRIEALAVNVPFAYPPTSPAYVSSVEARAGMFPMRMAQEVLGTSPVAVAGIFPDALMRMPLSSRVTVSFTMGRPLNHQFEATERSRGTRVRMPRARSR